ncbi:MAG TPA: pilus assembly protein TadG-related protein [Bacillota bacterium]|nr:pilus assembly protein TadG-related protein [Bacillota bacterium]
MKIIKNFLNEQKGFALILTTAGMLALLGFAALVTDIGMLALNKYELSNAVDAAALAGAQELPNNVSLAKSVAIDYALKNGCLVDEPVVSAHNGKNNSKITVTASKEVNYIFAKFLGISSGTVSASAAARLAGLTSHKGAVPLAVPDQNFDYNTKYILKQGANSENPSPLGPGTYGALSLSGTGASNYEYDLKYGFEGNLHVGQEIDTETGNMSNPTKRAIEYRISQCNHYPPCSPASYDPGCSRILVVPVYEPALNINGQIKRVKIIGFASFFVDHVAGQGNENYIEGYFLKMVAEGDSDPAQSDYGLAGVKLIK